MDSPGRRTPVVKMLEEQWILTGDLQGWLLLVCRVNLKSDMDCEGHPATMNMEAMSQF